MTYLTNFLINLFSIAKYILAVLAFASFFKKRRYFGVRVLCCLLLTVFLAAVAALFADGVLSISVPSWTTYIIYFTYTVCVLAWLVVCYRSKVRDYLFHCFSASILYAVLSSLRQIVLSFGRDGNGDGVIVSDGIWDILITILLMVLLYGGAYLVFGRKGNRYRDVRIGLAPFVVYIITGSILVLLSHVAETYKYTDPLSSDLVLVASVLFCLICLYVQYAIFIVSRSEMQMEKERIAKENAEQVSRESLRQYNTLKQNIDIINVKCHDMKHVLRNFRENAGADREKYMDELEQSIEIYDCSVKTGNDILDVLLTELNLRCSANKIRLICIADGEQIAFMDKADIFSLFGNIVDNAVEYLLGEEEANRYIQLRVYRQNDFAVIHEENYCAKTPQWGKDGLPRTSKGDPVNHGYGIRSIKMIAKKYGGSAAVTAADGAFTVAVLLPAPAAAGGADCAAAQ